MSDCSFFLSLDFVLKKLKITDGCSLQQRIGRLCGYDVASAYPWVFYCAAEAEVNWSRMSGAIKENLSEEVV